MYGVTPSYNDPLRQEGMSLLEGRPHFWNQNVHKIMVFRDSNSTLLIDVRVSY